MTMPLYLTYLEGALAKAEKDRTNLKIELDYYLHVDVNSQEHIQGYLRIHKDNPNYLTEKTDQLVDLDIAVQELTNLIWLQKRHENIRN